MNASTIEAHRSGGRMVMAWSVWLLAVTFVYYFSIQTGYAIVNSRIQKDLGLSVSQVGLIAAGYTWVFAVCQLISGPLLDRLGARLVLIPAMILVTGGVFVFANARSFEELLLSQVLLAMGACTGFVGAGYVGGRWFGMAKFSFMFGLVQFAAALFSAFSQNLLSVALSAFEWPTLFNCVGALGIILVLASALYLRDPEPVARSSGQDFGRFLSSIGRSLLTVMRIRHVWLAAAFGGLSFGVMLGLGVVWGPKLVMARGADAGTANLATSFLWLGLAGGCFVAPWISDFFRRRKVPILIGLCIQIASLGMLLYSTPAGIGVDFLLCFIFGFGNSAHMLAFSTAADVVEPEYIGTSAALVNGAMFMLGGVMISRPGLRIGVAIEDGMSPGSLDMVQFAGRPLILGICAAFVAALIMRETYPGRVAPSARNPID